MASGPAEDLEFVRRFLERGQAAVRPDAGHLVFWGLALCAGLALQYPAEVLDWAPSAVLWIWQPLAVMIWAGILVGRGRGRGAVADPTQRASRAVFAAAALAVAASYAGGLAGRMPDGYPTVLVACTAAALAFVVLGALTGRATAWAAAAGWFGLLAWFSWRGQLEPHDFLALALACAALLALPGLLLGRPAQARPGHGVFS